MKHSYQSDLPVEKVVKKIKEHKTTIFTILIACIVIIFLSVMICRSLKRVSDEASYKLSVAYATLSNADTQQAISVIDDIITNYSNTPSAYNARLLKADYFVSNQKYDEALELLNLIYQKAKPDTLKPLALSRIISLYDRKKDYANVIKYSNLFIKKFQKHFMLEDIYLNLANVYELQGQKDKAMEIYTEILEKYPNSQESQLASEYLKDIKK